MSLKRRAKGRAIVEGDRQVVEVEVDGGYWPSRITAQAGLPLRIQFHRLDADACTERVVFSHPRLGRTLEANATTGVDLPPQSSGEIRFTCGMGRYHGRIEIAGHPSKSARSWLGSIVDRLRVR
jgi:plastocyanin domain-containing protein